MCEMCWIEGKLPGRPDLTGPRQAEYRVVSGVVEMLSCGSHIPDASDVVDFGEPVIVINLMDMTVERTIESTSVYA